MNWEQIEGRWTQLKGAIREKWGKLTDDDLAVIAGKKDRLLGKLEERYGITKEEAEKQLESWNPTISGMRAEPRPERKVG